MPTDPASIARRLSPAQRKALLALLPVGYCTFTSRKKRLGVLPFELATPSSCRSWFIMTHLGAEVRAVLAAATGAEGGDG